MKSKKAIITFLDDSVDPGFGVPGFGGGNYPSTGPIYGGGRPDNSLPGYGHPDNTLPGGGHIALLPVFPFDPTIDNSLPTPPVYPGQGLPPVPGTPDQGLPPTPDNTLPGGSGGKPTHPIYTPIMPGMKYVVKWLACQGLILVPDNTLPTTPTPEPK